MEKHHLEANHEHAPGILRKSSFDNPGSGGARRKEYGPPMRGDSRGSKDETAVSSEADGCTSDTGESPKRRVRVRVDFDTEKNKSKRHYNLKKLAELNRAQKKLKNRDMKTVKSCEDFRSRTEKHSSPNKSCENLKGGYNMRSHRPGRDVTNEVNAYPNKSCENINLLLPDDSPLKRQSYHKSFEDLLTGKGLEGKGEKHHHKRDRHHHQHHGVDKSCVASPARSLPDRFHQASTEINATTTADKNGKGKEKKKEPKYVIKHTVKIEKWNVGVEGECNAEAMQKKFRMQAYSCGTHIVVPERGLPVQNTEEVRRIGLVDGTVVAELYGKRIRLHPGDIIEFPAGQKNSVMAEGEESATVILGTKQGCLIS
ncbi:uncharacterized protein LOC135490747 [Lineus longissimus]|uniref:uncharacterized protein LOC135490747 n=1 Tax=Lineus longissimus TaxID=88925 RepID=UPI00315C79F8